MKTTKKMAEKNNKLNDNNSNNDKLCLECDYSELERIRDYIKTKANLFGFSEEDSHRISLAVDEACSNLIRHAYKFDKSRKICINIESLQNQFVVNILDNGAPFNPLEVQTPDMNEYFKQFKRGGLGIQIIKLVMDEITYFPSTENTPTNVLKLKKVLAK